MSTCAVPSCNSNISRRRDLAFFPLPKDRVMRDEWLEVMSLKSRQVSDNTKVCELHFRAKDFSESATGKKNLKHHAVPMLRIGGKSSKYVDSDEEFMPCSSDSDPEILEVKKISKQNFSSPSTSKAKEEKVKIEEETPEPEPGRRPSRRAAQLAAKKIHNTVRSFAMSTDMVEDSVRSFHKESPKPSTRVRKASAPSPPKKQAPPPPPPARKFQFRDQKTWHSVRAPALDLSLEMECHEELLSPVQAEALMKAQIEYNNCMKKLRDLKANNVRIICEPTDESNSLASYVSSTVVATKQPGVVTIAPRTSAQPTVLSVLPIRLVTVQPSSGGTASVASMKPGSPAVIISTVKSAASSEISK